MSVLAGAAALSGGMSLVGGLYSDYANKKNMAKQHEYNVDMLNRSVAAQKNLFDYQFDANNQYNSPAATMERLKLAGLNPHLAYSGNGGLAGASTASMPSAIGSSNVGLPNSQVGASLQAGVDSALQLRQLDMQEKNLEHQNKKLDSDSKLTLAQEKTELLKLLREFDKDTPEWKMAFANYQKLDAETKKLNQETKTEEEKTNQARNLTRISEIEIENTKLVGDEKAANIAYIQQNILTSKSQEDLNRSAAALNRQLANESKEKQKKIIAETAGLLIDNTFKEGLNQATINELNARCANIAMMTNHEQQKMELTKLQQWLTHNQSVRARYGGDQASSIIYTFTSAFSQMCGFSDVR